MNVAPYPFERWPTVRPSEAGHLRSALRAAPRLDTARLLQLAAELLSTHVRLKAARLRDIDRAHLERELVSPLVALVLTSARTDHTLLVDVSPDLAANLVDRLLGGTGGATLGGSATLDATSRGVLGYLVARLLAANDSDWGLHAVTLDARRAIASLPAGPVVVGAWAVQVGEDVGRLRVWLAAPMASGGALARAPDAALLATEVALCADAGHAWLTRDEIDSLSPGDAVIVDRSGLERRSGRWGGQVALHVQDARRTQWRAQLQDDALTIEELRSSKELPMTEGKSETEGQTVVELAGDAPIEVCVEIARFTLPLEELAALRAGEVLRTGRPIGEHVALRAGGRVIARAELVDIEGEVGARIL